MQAVCHRSALRRSAPSRRAPSQEARRHRVVMAAFTAYVKGDPATNTLLDCPFCHRVLLTLETKGVKHDRQYINFASKPDWLVEKFGGKVPVIQDGDFWLVDSDKIVEYIEEKYSTPSLKSSVPPEIGATFFGAFRGFVKAAPEEAEEKKKAFEAELKTIDEYLTQHGPLFGGSSINATDAAFAPKLYHASVALPHFQKYTIPGEFKAIHTYLDTIKATDAWKGTDYGAAAILKGWGAH